MVSKAKLNTRSQRLLGKVGLDIRKSALTKCTINTETVRGQKFLAKRRCPMVIPFQGADKR